jgi:RND family efflux transporter MFP subunit
MKIIPTIIGLTLLATLIAGAWVLRYRPQWLASTTDAAAADDEDVDPQKLEIPVHTARITRATMRQYVAAFGTVEPAPARPGRMAGTADVAAPVAGVIADILCQAGQQVKKGEALVQLDDRVVKAAEEQAAASLLEAKASVDRARDEVDFAQKQYARQQDLASYNGTAAKNVEQAAHDLNVAKNELIVQTAKVAQAEAALNSARTQREIMKIVAPIDATIVAVSGNPGEAVDTTRVLIDMVALDRLVVTVAVPAEELAVLHNGLETEVSMDSSADKSTPGKIYFVGAEVDRKTNTVPVGIDISPDLGARPGQTIHVRIITEEHKDCLAVPRQSVVADENGDSFIALVEGDQATHKTVRVGLRQDNLVEIVADGIKEGDTVATGGAYGLAKFQVAKVKVLGN